MKNFLITLAICGLIPALTLSSRTLNPEPVEVAACPAALGLGHSIYFETTSDLVDTGDILVITNPTSSPLDVEVRGVGSGQKTTHTIAANSSSQTAIQESVIVNGLGPGSGPTIGPDDVKGLCGRDCFDGSTLVETSMGPRAISEITAGQLLISATDGTPCIVERVIRNHSRSLRRIVTQGGSFDVSLGHRLQLANGTWLEAAGVAAGMELATIGSGSQVVLDASELQLAGSTPVYNLVTSDATPIAVGPSGVIAATLSSSSRFD